MLGEKLARSNIDVFDNIPVPLALEFRRISSSVHNWFVCYHEEQDGQADFSKTRKVQCYLNSSSSNFKWYTICKCCHRNKEGWGIKLNYNSIARTGLYGSAILVHQYSCFFNKSILKVFGVCTVSAFVVSYKGKELYLSV